MYLLASKFMINWQLKKRLILQDAFNQIKLQD